MAYYLHVLMLFFTKLSDIYTNDTRNKSNYSPTRNKKVFADKAIRTTGPILWNSIDLKTLQMQFQPNIFGNCISHP